MGYTKLMSRGYQHKHTSVYLLNYHFVFCPKRRKKVLVGDVRARLIELFNFKAEELGWDVITLEVMPDHVHLFIGVEPDTPLAKICDISDSAVRASPAPSR